MNTRKYIILIFAALTLGSAEGRGQAPIGATQSGDVVYTLNLLDPASTLTDDVYFYTFDGAAPGSPFAGVGGYETGNFPNVSYGVPNVDDVGNPFGLYATSFGLFGIDTVASGATTNQSLFVAFDSANPPATGTSFDTLFAPFFSAHPDLTMDESTIVAVLQNRSITDQETTDDNGNVFYQFRDYVLYTLSNSTPATAAPIDTGTLTLYHFSDATAFGAATAVQIAAAPEPGTWALLAVGGLAVGMAVRRQTA